MPRGVYKKSEEHKRKLSEARRGKKTGPITEEARASLSGLWEYRLATPPPDGLPPTLKDRLKQMSNKK